MSASSKARKPSSAYVFSGQLRLRMPASLHRELSWAAVAERVSLNQFICGVLAGAVQWSGPGGNEERIRSEPDPYEQFHKLLRD
jgi:hypothetical protein